MSAIPYLCDIFCAYGKFDYLYFFISFIALKYLTKLRAVAKNHIAGHLLMSAFTNMIFCVQYTVLEAAAQRCILQKLKSCSKFTVEHLP